MPDLVIEARILNSLSGHYYGRSILRGCQLAPIEQRKDIVNRQRYDFYMAGRAAVAPYTILTYWTTTGVFAEADWPDFWILQAVPDAEQARIGFDPKWHFGIQGPLEVLAHAQGDDPATQLSNWWGDWAPKNGGQNEVIARWLGSQVGKHAYGKNPDLYPNLIFDLELKNPPFLSEEAWIFDLPK